MIGVTVLEVALDLDRFDVKDVMIPQEIHAVAFC